jgi:hypothetical protein
MSINKKELIIERIIAYTNIQVNTTIILEIATF